LAQKAYYGCKCMLIDGRVLIIGIQEVHYISYREFIDNEVDAILEDCITTSYVFLEPEDAMLIGP
jgi:hypothetical protein